MTSKHIAENPDTTHDTLSSGKKGARRVLPIKSDKQVEQIKKSTEGILEL